MKPTYMLIVLAAGLASCATDVAYRPANRPEKIEYRNDRLDVYPEDVRKDPARYAKMRVAWAGIIVSNNTTDEEMGGHIRMDTLFEHHYFDWAQDDHGDGVHLLISPRGEGFFRMRWKLHRKDEDANDTDALKYATPGKLAIVYGTPESVDDDGTIVMRYHYIRVLGRGHFADDELDYGRVGEPVSAVDAKP